MLSHIHIRHFAIIDELDLDLAGGMTALTGETGAGKSILVDALGLVLGDRADAAVVAKGAERAEIAAGFDLGTLPEAAAWLAEQDLDADGECHLRRVITREGRSRAYVNGRPAPVQTLRRLGELLVDIHGQHEHQSLLRRDEQRNLLDGFGGLGADAAAVAAAWRAWRDCRDELESLRGAARERGERLDLLRFQIDELAALELGPDEPAALDAEQRRLAHAGELLATCARCVAALDEDDDAAYSRINTALSALSEAGGIEPRLGEVAELLESARIQLQEAVDTLRRYGDGVELDPQRLAWVEERLGELHRLARKHQVRPEALPARLEALQAELDGLGDADQRVDALEARLATLAEGYRDAARKLGEGRRRAAAELATRITEAMQHLGMPGGRFEVAITARADDAFSPQGSEDVTFHVSANPGQDPMPLARVASGGELSRISLAIQVAAASAARIPTLVFDEVDTGIGGGVAEVVGRRLRELGAARQVLCVTHLPQVAAQAHQHLSVSKSRGRDHTRTRIEALNEDARVEEVARMLGGQEITETTRRHAREMVSRAGDEGGKRNRGAKGAGKGKRKAQGA